MSPATDEFVTVMRSRALQALRAAEQIDAVERSEKSVRLVVAARVFLGAVEMFADAVTL